MNILTTQHSNTQAAVAKGQSLGKVGVFIVVGLVGIIFATTFIAIQATIDDNRIQVSQSGDTLTATINASEDAELNWTYFNLQTSLNPSHNNSKPLAEKCRDYSDNAATNSTTLTGGNSVDVDISSHSGGDLYCFEVDTPNGVEHGGFISEY